MSELYITTTQNVKLFFTPASIGERILAHCVDLLTKGAYITLCIVLFNWINGENIITSMQNDTVSILLFILLAAPVAFYTLAFESLMEGQTPGKKLLKIKVVKIDGFQAGFFEYLTRWIFSLIDFIMGYVVGITSIVITKHNQRLGDLAAGTAVITEKSKYNISHTILMDIEDEYSPTFAQNQVILFSDNDMRIIKENYEMAIRRSSPEITYRLARKIETIMQIKSPFNDDNKLIEVLLKDYNYHTGQ